MNIVGVLPMAGTGSRLGLPFHKALTPTFDVDGRIIPLYEHARRRLLRVTNDIVAVLSPEGDRDTCLDNLPMPRLVKTTRGESPTSLAFAAQANPGTWMAMAFPDTIWYPENGFVKAHAVLLDESLDGVLLTFGSPGSMLDEVRTSSTGLVTNIIQKSRHRTDEVQGWGAFIVRSDAVAEWTDDGYISDNLERLKLKTCFLGNGYSDLGDPLRYRSHMTCG